jgi:hypothetical protein
MSEALVYGRIYTIQNGYNSWQGGYLDTRGRGCADNKLCVSTADSSNRDSGSGHWKISARDKRDGDPVLINDVFYLQNQYSSGGGYLDTRGRGCQDNLLCVSTADSSNRDTQSGSWKIFLDTGSSGVVHEQDAVHILNGYSNWQGGFLDTRGSGCADNKLCVSTCGTFNRDNGSTLWRFSRV